MDKWHRDRFIGGLGAAGGGLIFFSFFIYAVSTGWLPALIIGVWGDIFLSIAVLVHENPRLSKNLSP